MTRLAITGGPKAGKTTLARMLGSAPLGLTSQTTRHTDDLIASGRGAWSEASEAASRWLDEPGPWIVEGVAVPRALRKWRARNPGAPPPLDHLIYLTSPWSGVVRTPGQERMAKAVMTVFTEIEDWLRAGGVLIEYR